MVKGEVQRRCNYCKGQRVIIDNRGRVVKCSACNGTGYIIIPNV